MDWPADRVERRPLASLIPSARNARTHSDAQVGQIAASIGEWGWTMPVLVDEAGSIIAGHGRVLAAQRLGIGEVPTMVARGWSEAQKRAYVIADNKLTENGGWDQGLLRLELQDLAAMGFDALLTGFSASEIKGMGTAGKTDPDEAPPAPEAPISRPGDVWLLADHRLACGDATSAADVAQALDGSKPHLMVTDPPYGVEYDPTWRDSLDDLSRARGRVLNDDRADWRDAWALFPGDVAYCWSPGGDQQMVHCAALAAAGFGVRTQIIWTKPHFVIGRGNYHIQHESCWYAVRKGKTAHWMGDRTQSTVWQISNALFQGKGGQSVADKFKSGHGTQKPVECMKRPIENNSAPGDAVYDPFVGSGTTIIAAEMTGRACRAIEINPAYVDVAVLRWQNFTGDAAVLEATGGRFPLAAAELEKEIA